MQKRYPNDEIEEIEKEGSGSTWYIVAFIIILLTLGALGALIVLYGPQLREWSNLQSNKGDLTFYSLTNNKTTCTPITTCSLLAAQTVGVYAGASIFNEAGSSTIYGDAVTNSASGLVGGFPPVVTGNTYTTLNTNVSQYTDDIENYTACVSNRTCSDYSRDPYFFQRPIRPGVYCKKTTGPDSTLSGKWDVVLDGRNIINPVWIFILDFSMVMEPSSRVRVINTNYTFNNVWYFKKGYVYIGRDSSFQGSIIAKNNVIMETNTTVTGKVISLTGFIATSNSSINISEKFGPKNCTA